MTTQRRALWRRFLGRAEREPGRSSSREQGPAQPVVIPAPELAPDDPLIAYLRHRPGATAISDIEVDSPALSALRASGAAMVVPLVSQGELIGLLNLGPRRDRQPYSVDDRALLTNLAAQAAPPVRVAQLVRQQQAEAQERERIDQELQVARLIQQTLLPKAVPERPGWQMAAYYRPAREVGGDFYDFLDLPDGRLGIVVGDVTSKGVPAALVMATTRSVLRATALQLIAPGQVLEQANALLYPDMPPKMFVTCFYAVLDPASGRLSFANAGHHLPYRRHRDGVTELRATGMPLGAMPSMRYEEQEACVGDGDTVLFYSDGLVEAHDSGREMFGFPRLRQLLVDDNAGGAAPIAHLLDGFAQFTGLAWEPEDDITLVSLHRCARQTPLGDPGTHIVARDDRWNTLAAWSVASQAGNERLTMERVEEVVRGLNLAPKRLERLKTAVAEATLNAMEHGNRFQPHLPVDITVRTVDDVLSIQITDRDGGPSGGVAEMPDIEAKLAGRQSPRGWGLFLIEQMVDEMRVSGDDQDHTLELIMRLGGDVNAG